MRQFPLVLLFAVIAACGGDSTDNNKPPSPLEVTLKSDGSVQPGVTVVTQVTVGDVTTLPLITSANGQVSGTRTIQPGDRTPGAIETPAYCAADPPGSSICDTKLNGPDAIHVTF
jgi:hypothetical protein